jgi:ribosome-associated toxin RatA of RatAB toxin-antitoxin module
MTTHIQRSALLPYPAQALYDLVNDVASYPQFLPWCSSAEVLESSETHMRASLNVAKGGLSQHFVTRNTLVPGQSIEMNLDLSFDYAGPLVRATLGPLFNQAANTLVDAFCQRAKQNAELKR